MTLAEQENSDPCIELACDSIFKETLMTRFLKTRGNAENHPNFKYETSNSQEGI